MGGRSETRVQKNAAIQLDCLEHHRCCEKVHNGIMMYFIPYPLHHHVFDTRLVVEVVDYMKLQILMVEPFCPFHIAVIARKILPNQKICNTKYRASDAQPCWVSPFPSDRIVPH